MFENGSEKLTHTVEDLGGFAIKIQGLNMVVISKWLN